MNTIETLYARHSTRAFTAEEIKKDILEEILAAALRAPSWANTQPWEIFVATGAVLEELRQEFIQNFEEGVKPQPELSPPQSWPPQLKQRMQELGRERLKILGIERGDEEGRRKLNRRNFEFFGAPTVVYLCLDRSLTSWSIFDMGILTQSILLAAEDLGVSSIPAVNLVAYPNLIRQKLNIPTELMILFGIALGYADSLSLDNQFRSARRPLAEVVRFFGI